jgi:hypothetical protein
MIRRLLVLATIALLALAPAARAAGYDIQPLTNDGKFLGCMAINQAEGVVLLAVENGLAVLVTSTDFKVAKGDDVKGTWSIDNSKSRPLADKANGDGTVSIDLQLTKEDFALLGDGDELEVVVGKVSKTFTLAGSSKGLAGLSGCMKNAGK